MKSTRFDITKHFKVEEAGVTSAGNVIGIGGNMGSNSSAATEESSGCAGVPAHALVALALLLKLPGYAAALLDEGARAVHLLRLLLGVAHDEEGRQYKDTYIYMCLEYCPTYSLLVLYTHSYIN